VSTFRDGNRVGKLVPGLVGKSRTWKRVGHSVSADARNGNAGAPAFAPVISLSTPH
jgi:hypothetical protein